MKTRISPARILQRTGGAIAALALVVTSMSFSSVMLSSTPAVAADGAIVQHDPIPLWTEDFEQGTNDDVAVPLTTYNNAIYTADSYWANT